MPIHFDRLGVRPTKPIGRILLSGCLGCALLVSGGCRKKETFAVRGKVTFDGEAVSNGEIQFLPADQPGAPAAGRIENGEYHLQARPGAKRVSIRAARKIEQTLPGTLGPPFQDYIPAQFNSESTLTAEVQPNDDNHADFELKTGAQALIEWRLRAKSVESQRAANSPTCRFRSCVVLGAPACASA